VNSRKESCYKFGELSEYTFILSALKNERMDYPIKSGNDWVIKIVHAFVPTDNLVCGVGDEYPVNGQPAQVIPMSDTEHK